MNKAEWFLLGMACSAVLAGIALYAFTRYISRH